MYLSVKQQITGMSVSEYQTLRLLCRLSKNLYNEALYSVRQFYFAEKKYLNYVANYHVCKESENYKSLGTDIAQQTIIDRKSVKEIRIHPKHKAQFFELEFVYDKELIKTDLDAEKFLGIDLGLDNLATCVTNDGSTFIVDGKKLKSYNRLWNKENARLQSEKDKHGIKIFTRRQYLNLRKRNRRVNHAMSVAAKRIINYCIENRIGNIVVGYNVDWKRGINIGKQNNQNFVQIPHGKLREKLKYLCELYSIRYIEQEESYTSKASFFDNDILSVYNANNPQEYRFIGKRITRGQYRTASGMIFNADVNGALNILRKCSLISLVALQDRGEVSTPRRIRIF